MKEAGWNFGMGICNAYLGTDLWAKSLNDPCKVGALTVGIAVEQSCHYFQIIFQTLCFLQAQYLYKYFCGTPLLDTLLLS